MDKEQDIVEKAKKFATKTFHRPFSDTPEEPITLVEPDRYEGYIGGYKEGYEQALKNVCEKIENWERDFDFHYLTFDNHGNAEIMRAELVKDLINMIMENRS